MSEEKKGKRLAGDKEKHFVRSADIRAYPSLVRNLNSDPEPFLAACEIAEEQLAAEDTQLPIIRVVDLLEMTAKELNVPDFGLRLAAFQGLDFLGPLSSLVMNCRNVKEALEISSRYISIHSSALMVDIEVCSETAAVSIQLSSGLVGNKTAQSDDASLGVALNMLKFLTQDDSPLDAVDIVHDALGPVSMYEDYFSAPVRLGCRKNVIYIPLELLLRKPAHRSETVYAMASKFLEEKSNQNNAPVSAKVSEVIREYLPTDYCTREAVASAIAMHPRTMIRHLKKEGTSYGELVDNIRHKEVERYLKDGTISIAEVAYLVGYSEQAVLTRSCKRWFGLSPLEARKAMLQT